MATLSLWFQPNRTEDSRRHAHGKSELQRFHPFHGDFPEKICFQSEQGVNEVVDFPVALHDVRQLFVVDEVDPLSCVRTDALLK